MACNHNCKQGKSCNCYSSKNEFSDIAELSIELAGVVFAIALIAMVLGMASGWLWG